MPSRVDSAFLNIVVPPYGNTDYSWFVDYEKPAFVVTTSGLVSAGQVPGMSAAPGTIGPYVGTDPRGRPAGCSQRGGFCPSSVGSPMKLSRERRGGKDW